MVTPRDYLGGPPDRSFARPPFRPTVDEGAGVGLIPPAERVPKTMVCFEFVAKGTCKTGGSCPHKHLTAAQCDAHREKPSGPVPGPRDVLAFANFGEITGSTDHLQYSAGILLRIPGRGVSGLIELDDSSGIMRKAHQFWRLARILLRPLIRSG